MNGCFLKTNGYVIEKPRDYSLLKSTLSLIINRLRQQGQGLPMLNSSGMLLGSNTKHKTPRAVMRTTAQSDNIDQIGKRK